ncbi:MAG: hypothetical protein IBJ00_07655, partial [Alphaproteobacteria bacterium]|nr:hypothetical protein [Alphaproteobacteria bacterium]
LMDAGVSVLTKGLMRCSCIEKLILISNNITDKGAADLAPLLKRNFPLFQLDLSYNKINDEGIRYLVSGLNENNFLACLNLTNNPISDQGANLLKRILINNKNLLEIQLPRKLISKDLSKQIFQYLRRNKLYNTLLLQNDTISELNGVAAKVIKILLMNSSITQSQIGFFTGYASRSKNVKNSISKILKGRTKGIPLLNALKKKPLQDVQRSLFSSEENLFFSILGLLKEDYEEIKQEPFFLALLQYSGILDDKVQRLNISDDLSKDDDKIISNIISHRKREVIKNFNVGHQAKLRNCSKPLINLSQNDNLSRAKIEKKNNRINAKKYKPLKRAPSKIYPHQQHTWKEKGKDRLKESEFEEIKDQEELPPLID